MYPYAGQTNLLETFYAAYESPRPSATLFPNTTAGTPVIVNVRNADFVNFKAAGTLATVVTKFEMKGSGGNLVAAGILASSGIVGSGVTMSPDSNLGEGFVVLVPLSPLSKGVTYTAAFTATLKAGGTPVTKTWTCQYTSDAHCHTYSLVEVETACVRVDLPTVMAANELDRAIEPAREVAMAVLRSGAGSKAKNVVLDIYDRSEKRTFVNEEMFTLRTHARKQAFLYSLMSVVMLPVAFLLFVAPGFVWLWVLWKSWSSISEYPTPEESRESVVALSFAAHSSTPA